MDSLVVLDLGQFNTSADAPWKMTLMETECCALKKCCKAYKKKGKHCKKCPKLD